MSVTSMPVLSSRLGPQASAQVRPTTSSSAIKKVLGARAFSHEEEDEFMSLFYTPCVNRKPVDLREPLTVLADRTTNVQLCICVTVYNEEGEFLKRTLRGIAWNLVGLKALGIGWKDVVVCIIVDGIAKAHPSLLQYCETELKIFDSSMLLPSYMDSPVTLHMFERPIRLAKHPTQREYFDPLQTILGVKTKNGGKLNSHLWFFSAFCRQIKPHFVLLVDVGTEPAENAIADLCDAMLRNRQLGGVCGEIAVRNARIYNVLESAQKFEYKVAHVLDKAMESVFGYISVLPGAFSAYRYEAIRWDPLNAYFMVEENTLRSLGPFMANMYLAEDRILCFEILVTKERAWTLHFVPGAYAYTDVPATLTELIKQRRRWLNGAFFSLLYYIHRFSRFRKSSHGIIRRLALYVQLLYNLVNMLFSWFMVGSLFLSLDMVFRSTFLKLPILQDELHWIFLLAYAFLFLLQVLVGLGGTADTNDRVYYVCCLVYGFLMIIAISLSIWHVASLTMDIWLAVAVGSTFMGYLGAAILHNQLLSTLSSLPQYLFMVPTFINLFTTYSFCNLHDISWGTKEGNLVNERARPRVKSDQPKRPAGRRRSFVQNIVNLGHGLSQEDTQAKVDAYLNPAAGLPSIPPAIAHIAASQLPETPEQQAARKEIEADNQQAAKEFMAFRTRCLGLWLATNGLYAAIVAHFEWFDQFSSILAYVIVFTVAFRMVGCVWFQVEHMFDRLILTSWCRSLIKRCKCCRWLRERAGILKRHVSVTDANADRVFKTKSFFMDGTDSRAHTADTKTSMDSFRPRLQAVPMSDDDDDRPRRGRGRRNNRRRSRQDEDDMDTYYSSDYSDRSSDFSDDSEPSPRRVPPPAPVTPTPAPRTVKQRWARLKMFGRLIGHRLALRNQPKDMLNLEEFMAEGEAASRAVLRRLDEPMSGPADDDDNSSAAEQLATAPAEAHPFGVGAGIAVAVDIPVLPPPPVQQIVPDVLPPPPPIADAATVTVFGPTSPEQQPALLASTDLLLLPSGEDTHEADATIPRERRVSLELRPGGDQVVMVQDLPGESAEPHPADADAEASHEHEHEQFHMSHMSSTLSFADTDVHDPHEIDLASRRPRDESLRDVLQQLRR